MLADILGAIVLTDHRTTRAVSIIFIENQVVTLPGHYDLASVKPIIALRDFGPQGLGTRVLRGLLDTDKVLFDRTDVIGTVPFSNTTRTT